MHEGLWDSSDFEYKHAVTPEDYLSFAQRDLQEGGNRGLINALSNAKRSIDCLVETVLESLGVDPGNIPDSAITFSEEVLPGKANGIRPQSLRLFCALGLAPSFLISEVRMLRNKVEHEYKIPKHEDVVKSIEVADLLLNNIKAKEIYSCCIEITDPKRRNEKPGRISGIRFSDDIETTEDNRCIFSLKSFCNDKKLSYDFKGNEIELFFLLRAMFVASHDLDKLGEAIKNMLKNIKLKTPDEHIKIGEVFR